MTAFLIALYGIIGVIYAFFHFDRAEGDTAIDFAVDFLLWPVFLILAWWRAA